MSGKTLGQIGYEGFVAFQEPGEFEYETWADKDEHGDSATMGRADWEAAAQAVAAHAAGTAAEDGNSDLLADLLEEIFENAPEGYDGDDADVAIAVRYVRDLEAIARGSVALRAACEGLNRICMGTADEADSSSIAEKALYAAIGHMPVSAIGTDVPDTTPIDEWPEPLSVKPSDDVTPGRAAYARSRIVPPLAELPHIPWSELSFDAREFWDEVAQAAIAAQQPQPAPELAAEHDQLRERVARVAASLDADALATAPSKKSQIQEDAARRIREAIG